MLLLLLLLLLLLHDDIGRACIASRGN